MQKSQNTSKWYQNAWAALMFFTRLPLWRIYQPPRDSFKAVVEFWPLAGWLTGGIMGLVLYVGAQFLPYPVAILLAIVVRLLITGCLHEDGLADFCDGFGGGTNRQRILEIMKDSHIGTYGVIGLIMYFALLFTSLLSLSPLTASLLVFTAGAFSKMLASQIVQMMPYARTEEQAKARVVYRNISIPSAISLSVQGLLPVVIFIYFIGIPSNWQWMILIPCLVMYFLYLLIWRKLRGYTGDCCGAMCLLIELSIYLSMTASSL